MENLLTPSNTMFVIGILGVIFSVFNYFRNPQEALETKQALSEKDIDDRATLLQQKEAENKAALLDQAVKLEREANEKKFSEMSLRLTEAMTMAQNHIHTVDVKVDGLNTRLSTLAESVIKLGTIIEERIPKK